MGKGLSPKHEERAQVFEIAPQGYFGDRGCLVSSFADEILEFLVTIGQN